MDTTCQSDADSEAKMCLHVAAVAARVGTAGLHAETTWASAVVRIEPLNDGKAYLGQARVLPRWVVDGSCVKGTKAVSAASHAYTFEVN